MPNGGSDNCGECQFFSKNNFKQAKDDEFRLPHCLLRRIPITKHPFYTYCDNSLDSEPSNGPRGSVYIDGGTYPHTRKLWIDENEQNKLMNEQQIIADFCKKNLGLANYKLGDEFSYKSLALCVIDVIFSIGVKYSSVTNTIQRIKSKIPEADSLTISDLLKSYDYYSIEGMVNEIFGNRQRTSTRNGILKAEAVQRFCRVLLDFDVNQINDVEKVIANKDFEAEIKSIPGQSSGISLVYFYILTGAKDYVKPDRMIQRFLSATLNRKVKESECQRLIFGASLIIEKEYPEIRASIIDHLMWKYQSGRDLHKPIEVQLSEFNL
jgi:hypothetical protein